MGERRRQFVPLEQNEGLTFYFFQAVLEFVSPEVKLNARVSILKKKMSSLFYYHLCTFFRPPF